MSIWLYSFSLAVFAQPDLMEVLFQPAKEYEKIVNLGNTKRDVGNDVFRESLVLSLSDGITRQAPLIVRITKFLLRITVVLSITMVIYNGILWIIESAKWGDVKDAKNNIIYIVVWILLALSSVWLINLITSFSVSSLVTS
jgi:hypothetical protein